MKTHSARTAQKLMNLYRSAFAIEGGWRAVNEVLAAEADDSVLAEISKLPCGQGLAQHIFDLKNGRVDKGSIDPELLPYGGAMQPPARKVSGADYDALKSALTNFVPDAAHIDQIRQLAAVRQFGDKWRAGVGSILDDDSLAAVWRNVLQSESALRLWGRAAEILASSPSDLLRAEVQADMPEYETYLPMFGGEGLDILSRLRQFIV
jgi:hypothetical protein